MPKEPSPDLKECTICRGNIPRSRYPNTLPTSTCTGHGIVVCTSCLAKHIGATVNGKGATNVLCPIHACGKPLDFSDIQRYASKNVFERYDYLLLRQSLQQLEGFRWCKNPECGNGQIHEGGNDYPIMKCSACRSKSCFRHDIPWHSNETCDDFELRLGANVDEAASAAYKLRMTKPCPNCQTPIEKNNGCDHMTCAKPFGCGFDFCWLCLSPYNLILEEGNHRHRETCQYYAPLPDIQSPVAGPSNQRRTTLRRFWITRR